MCICVAESTMNNTILYAGEAIKDNKLVHVLAYQNSADNLSNGPNAMVIPFPTSSSMSQDNIIDTRSFKHFLSDIAEASRIKTRSYSLGMTASVASLDALVFDVGSYTVVLAENIKQILKALAMVPDHKRPAISYRFLRGYSELYKDLPVAVCCWDGTLEAEPLLWWYEPKNKDVLFAPTMDAHNGNAPDVTAAVLTDHIISAGSVISPIGNRVSYTDDIPPSVAALLPTRVYGTKMKSRIKNGDTFINTKSITNTHSSYGELARGVSLSNIDLSIKMKGWR